MSLSRRQWITILGIALIPRLLLWARLCPSPSSYLRPDSPTYLELAEGLSLRRKFSLPLQDRPETFRTPGYPLFLAMISNHLRLISILQVGLDTATSMLIALCAVLLARSAPAAWAGLIYALDPMAAAHSVLILSEPLFNFLLTLCLYFHLRAWRQQKGGILFWVISGLGLGLAVLTRPVALYLWIPWSVALLFAKQRLKHILGFSLAAILLPGFWCLRNYALLGEYAFTSISGWSLLSWEAPAVKAAAEKIPVSRARQEFERDFAARNPRPFLNAFDESRARRATARKYLTDHPWIWSQLRIVSTVKMLLGPGLDLLASELWPNRDFGRTRSTEIAVTGGGTLAMLRETPVLWILLIYVATLLALGYGLAFYGGWFLWSSERTVFRCGILVPLLYFLVLSGGGWSYYRFRVPIWPLVSIMAGGASRRLRR